MKRIISTEFGEQHHIRDDVDAKFWLGQHRAMPPVLVDLWNFILAVISNWLAFMTVFLLVIDDLIRWCSPSVSEWLDKRLSREKRRKIEILLMSVGVGFACFLAYDNEHDLRIQDEKKSKTSDQNLEAALGKLTDAITGFEKGNLNDSQTVSSLKGTVATLEQSLVSDRQAAIALAENKTSSSEDALKQTIAAPIVASPTPDSKFDLDEATAVLNQRMLQDDAKSKLRKLKDQDGSRASAQFASQEFESIMALFLRDLNDFAKTHGASVVSDYKGIPISLETDESKIGTVSLAGDPNWTFEITVARRRYSRRVYRTTQTSDTFLEKPTFWSCIYYGNSE